VERLNLTSVHSKDVSNLNKAIRELQQTNTKLGIQTRHDLSFLSNRVVNLSEDFDKTKMQEYTAKLDRLEVIHTQVLQDISAQLQQLSESIKKSEGSDLDPMYGGFFGTMEEYVETLQHSEVVPAGLPKEILGYLREFSRSVQNDGCGTSSISQSILSKMEEYMDTLDDSERIVVRTAREVSAGLAQFAQSLRGLEHAGRDTTIYQALLKRLYFPNLNSRHRSIETAHFKTFEWIFTDIMPQNPEGKGRHHFVEWLLRQTGMGPFWVQGKAGSGKSTLMKFISSHPETMKHLRDWAAGKKLIVASFFFWNAGTILQRSQEGLLRSLLFEILRTCPEMIPSVTASVNIFDDFQEEDYSWSLDELWEMYRAIFKQDI